MTDMTEEKVGLDYMLARAERLQKENYEQLESDGYSSVTVDSIVTADELAEATAERVSEYAAGSIQGTLHSASEVEDPEDRDMLYSHAMNEIRHFDQDPDGWTILEEEKDSEVPSDG